MVSSRGSRMTMIERSASLFLLACASAAAVLLLPLGGAAQSVVPADLYPTRRIDGRVLVDVATNNEDKMNALVYIVSFGGNPVITQYADVFVDNTLSNSAITNSFQRSQALRRQQQRRKEADQYSQKLETQQDAILQRVLKAGKYETIQSITYVSNSASVKLTDLKQIGVLTRSKGVVRVEKDYHVTAHTTHSPQLLKLSSAAGAWSLVSVSGGSVQTAGEDIVIGMVDTGITPDHPSFSDDSGYSAVPASFLGNCTVEPQYFPSGSCNRKLVGARHYSQSITAYGLLDPVADFDSPFDGDGHGTHTSAIAGGNNNISVEVYGMTYGRMSGMAPRARVSTYKCIFRNGGFLSDCVAAIDQAVQDGVQIISMSLGPSSPPDGVAYLSALDIAMLLAVKAGVVVVQSAGNAGSSPGTVSSFSPWTITVGATVTDRTYPVFLNLGSGKTVQGIAFTAPLLVATSLISSADSRALNLTTLNSSNLASPVTECQDPNALNETVVRGKILICFYSDNFDAGYASVQQVNWVADVLGAVGLVIVNDPTLSYPPLLDSTPFYLPAIFIQDQTTSKIVTSYYGMDPSSAIASITIPSNMSADFSTINPVVADYSSRGPSPSNANSGETSDVLKPNIIAPGNQIWSAWSQAAVDLPNWDSTFATLSGTSMAAPHVSGIVGLLRQRHPTWSVAMIHSALTTTATIVNSLGKPIQAINDENKLIDATPFDMGGGFVNAVGAFDPGLVFDCQHQDYINFICTIKTVTNDTVYALTGTSCNITANSKPSDLNSPSITIAMLKGNRTVVRKLTNVGSVSETYTTSLKVPSNTAMTITPSTFTIAPGATQAVTILIKTTVVRTTFFHGRITWSGNKGHKVSIPVSVFPYSLS